MVKGSRGFRPQGSRILLYDFFPDECEQKDKVQGRVVNNNRVGL